MLKIHFLNVGHGDCIIVEFPSGRNTVIDINMSNDMDDTSNKEVIADAHKKVSLADKILYAKNLLNDTELFEKAGYKNKVQNPISYMKENNINSVFRFISTHPHLDHLTGIKELHDEIGINTLWISKNTEKNLLKNLSEKQEEDWRFYKKYRDTDEYLLDGIYTIRPSDGQSNNFWNEDKITILAPDPELLKSTNSNILSYVLLIEYGGKKIVLGGDGEEATWKYIMNNYKDLIKDVSILKASHHGRGSGYYQEAVKHMNPMFTIVSVGKKPSTDVSNKYRTYCENVWSTRWKGNIWFEINNDKTWSYHTQYDR